MVEKKLKESAYARRNLLSVPAPLESDSDPEFNAGTFVYEKPQTKRSKKRKITRASADAFDIVGSSKPTASTSRAHIGQNPLAEFFGDLDLHSASEADDNKDEADMEVADLEDDDERSDISDTDEQPILLRSLAGFVSREQRDIPVQADQDSVTEPETDDDMLPNNSKRKSPASASQDIMPPAKRVKTVDSETETEPESETEIRTFVEAKTTKRSKSPPTQASGSHPHVTDTDSVTESESEVEDRPQVSLMARPNFPLAPGQDPQGSLVLDAKQHVRVPASINNHLREYQRDGVKFFWDHYKAGYGGLMGDDMGLGKINHQRSKTIQVISFLSAIMKKNGNIRDIDRRQQHVSHLQDLPAWKQRRELPPANATWPTCLIIAPSTVVGNWEREFQTWGYFEVGLYMGAPSEREQVLKDFKMGRLDVVLTSFDIARIDIEFINDLAWSVVIVDEVHRVKNPRSKMTEALGRFDARAIRFGLTGTAIQNSYTELWTILDWCVPGGVGTKKQWEGYIVRPLVVGQSSRATEEEKAKATIVSMTLKEKLLPKFFIRRTKDLIKHQLPRKTDEVVFCPLTPKQIEVYKRILDAEPVKNMMCKDEECDCGSRQKSRECCHPFDKGDLFKYMSALIKISNHLALILPSPMDKPEQTLRNRELSEFAFPNETPPKYGPSMLLPKFCGKWMVLEMLLTEWHKDPLNKVLIFTKSVKLLDMLDFHLSSHNYGFVRLDGSTKGSDRMPIIDKFNHEPGVFVFLISTMAGGTGLNLTGANKVVIFDPNWNPAHDLQAMDRAYRFGQTRDVSVYRLLGAGSIEELIYARQLYKQQQMKIGYEASIQTRYFQGVQNDKTRQGELFGIKNIFKLQEDTLATKMAIEKANLVNLDWALTHMDGKSKKRAKNGAEVWVYEAEAKGIKEDGDLRGLGALLLDDVIPEVKKEDEIHKTLNGYGVKYSHRNDEILLPSHIEQERARTTLEEHKRTRKARKSKDRSKSLDMEWPPKRKHHKAPPSPKSKLKSRQVALIQLGFINNPMQLPAFAQDFSRKSLNEQTEMIAKLDEHAKKSRK